MIELLVINTQGLSSYEASTKAITIYNQINGIKSIKQIIQCQIQDITFVTIYYEYATVVQTDTKPFISGEAATFAKRPPISHDIDKSCISNGFVVCNAEALPERCKACILSTK